MPSKLVRYVLQAGKRTSNIASLRSRVGRRIGVHTRRVVDRAKGGVITALDRWPCNDRKYLLVGSESSGTTAVADFLFEDIPGFRFLNEGKQAWVWEAYQRIYQGQAGIRDYPRLQLFDAIKVPGFAMIIEEFRRGFPNTGVVYMVRDPRDFVSSAIRTWRVQGIHDLRRIPWVAEDWLGIPNADPVERLCMRWKAYLEAASNSEDVVFVRYEDFCEHKLSTIRDLADEFGLPFNATRVDERKDQQISHPGVRDYQPGGPGAWKTGLLADEHIRTIERLCGEEMRRWAYLPETAC